MKAEVFCNVKPLWRSMEAAKKNYRWDQRLRREPKIEEAGRS
jgi:hypothetical protein